MLKAVVLLSGGLDSATALAIAKEQGFQCYVLSVDYGQRHVAELKAAAAVTTAQDVKEHRVMKIDLAGIGGSALTDPSVDVPHERTDGIPVTYVPARNTVLLSLALGWAEVLAARDIFLGVNAIDYPGYPDCRPEFVRAFEKLANLATKAGVEGTRYRVQTPLITLTKAEIIRKGMALGVDYALTISCYCADDDGRACGTCDACAVRKQGFEKAGTVDPTRYQQSGTSDR